MAPDVSGQPGVRLWKCYFVAIFSRERKPQLEMRWASVHLIVALHKVLFWGSWHLRYLKFADWLIPTVMHWKNNNLLLFFAELGCQLPFHVCSTSSVILGRTQLRTSFSSSGMKLSGSFTLGLCCRGLSSRYALQLLPLLHIKSSLQNALLDSFYFHSDPVRERQPSYM